jgi:DNA-binding ferritin-like protein
MSEKNPLDLYYDMKEGRIKLANKQIDSSAVELLNGYIALLRVIYLVHQHGHWKSFGPEFFSDHKMFESLYESASSRVDDMVERLIGIYGPEAFIDTEMISKMSELNKFNSNNAVENSLEAEKLFIQYAEDTYNRIKELGEMTLGLDDLIMSQVSDAEKSIYFLKQRKGV